MNVEHERELELDATAKDVSDRLNRWATASAFICIRETAQGWSYERGSSLAALYTFDIRKIPTDVQVDILSENPLTVHCKWHVEAALTISTPGDAKRIAEQFDLLIAYLKGAL